MTDSYSALTITEMGGQKRKITLTGRALPFRPISFGSEFRAEFTHYPGSPQATMQMLGPKEGTTSIKGFWHDRYIKTDTVTLFDSSPATVTSEENAEWHVVADVMELAMLFDDVCHSGQVITLAWDAYVRVGVMRKFTATPHRKEDIEWEAEFEWASQGQPEQVPRVSDELDTQGLTTGLYGLAQKLKVLVRTVTDPVASFQAQLNDSLADVEAAVQTVASTGQLLTNVATAPAEALARIGGTLTFMASAANNMKAICQHAYEVATLSTDSVAALVMHAEESRQIAIQARETRDSATRSRSDVARYVPESADLLGTYLARGGEDLRAVARRYYGTPDAWRALAAFNGLATSQLTAGMELFIPRMTTRG